MEIVTGSTGQVHVTPIDDAVRNGNQGYLNRNVVFTYLSNFEAASLMNNEIRVYSGYGMMQGRLFKIDNNEWDSVVCENGSQGFKRADLVVARYTMDSQTGFEDISLVVIKGSAGNTYVDPSYNTGDINDGDTCDFPLYRVRINGLNIEGLDRMFTPIPDGGRLGELEARVAAHKAEYDALNIRTNLASESAVYPKNGANARPGVEGILPANHGGSGANNLKTGANNFIGALDTNGTSPVDGDYYIGTTPNTAGYQRKPLTALKAWVEEKIKALLNMGTGTIVPVTNGGTGKGSITSGSVLVGNGTNTPTERAIDTNPTLESNNLITSGAVAEALASKGYGDMLRATYDPNLDGIIGIANGGTGSNDGTLNGVKLAKSGSQYGYMDGATFKSFRQPTGNAVVGNVLSGKTFANASNDALIGTMPNRGAVSQSLNCGGSYTIPAGYHNGSGKVTANSLASQTGVDSGKYALGASALLTGYQGWVNGNKITGAMANYSNAIQTIATAAGTGVQKCGLGSGYHTYVNVDRTATYDSGIAAAQAITWTELISGTGSGSSAVSSLEASLVIPYKNVVKIKNISGGNITVEYRNSSGLHKSTLADKVEMAPPPDAIYYSGYPGYWVARMTLNNQSYSSVGIQVTFQAKVLR